MSTIRFIIPRKNFGLNSKDIMRKVFLIIFITVLCFLTYSGTKAQSLLSNGKIPKDLKITLERLGCLGVCPAYSLVIKANGSVLFNRKNFINRKNFKKTRANFEDQITEEQIKQIIDDFEKANFFLLRNSYVTENDGCKKYPPDGSAEKLSIRINGKKKTVFHYLGCGKTIIRNLSEKIDKITNSNRWIEERK